MSTESQDGGLHAKCIEELDLQIRSNRPIIYICTHEEHRVQQAIEKICSRKNSKWPLYVWDIADFITTKSPGAALPTTNEVSNQDLVLTWFEGQSGADDNTYLILLLKDFHKFLGVDGHPGEMEHVVVRRLRNLAHTFKTQHKTIILMGTSLELPPDLEKVTAVIDWPLPEKADIQQKVEKMLETASARPEVKSIFQTEYDDHALDEIIASYQGLTLTEVELLFTYMMLSSERLDPKLISAKKRDIIRKSGIIEWVDSDTDIDNVGGLGGIKQWLHKRRNAFGQEAQEYGLPHNPKGILLVGVQGGGKSLIAKAVASFFKFPILKLDMGKVFSGIVGSSEENMRQVIKVAESVAPCILWADEFEKGFSGIGSSNQTDGGTTARVFATTLNWMQEKNSQVFLVATANDVSQLPPELIRKGRFDEIFFVPLPNDEERTEIFHIHLQKRGRNPNHFELSRLISNSDKFTGAEIEAAIVSAMYEAFDDNKRPVTTEDIVLALKETVPIAVQMSAQIDALNMWAQTRARNASAIVDDKKSTVPTTTMDGLDGFADDEEL